MNNECITPQESISIHEIIMFKVLCATKAGTMKALVQDEELKKLLEQDVIVTKDHLEELIVLLRTSPFLVSDNKV